LLRSAPPSAEIGWGVQGGTAVSELGRDGQGVTHNVRLFMKSKGDRDFQKKEGSDGKTSPKQKAAGVQPGARKKMDSSGQV